MKKTLFPVFLMAVSVSSEGQIAKWLIPPKYDDIHMVSGEKLIITDSLEQKILWSQSGKRLSSTVDQLFPFKEGYAVTTKSRTSSITGFYNGEGVFTPLSECNVAHSRPYFSNNYLLVQSDSYYRFVDTEGNFMEGLYASAFPFANGYASCNTFANLQKEKDPYNLLITKEHNRVFFSYNDKQFDNDDIEFISSVNDENIGIVVAKRRLYYFNGKDRSLSPIFAKKDETNNKNQAKLDDDFSQCFKKEDSIFVLKAKCGKNDGVQIKFDTFHTPLSITLSDGEYIYKKNTSTPLSHKSPLKQTKENEKYGISWENQEILPPQFDDFISCFDDKAFVQLSGKCGMLKVLKDEDFDISINKGAPIGFKHRKFDTTVQVKMPNFISSQNTKIIVKDKESDRIKVDMTSIERKDTEDGNVISYNCTLMFPPSLPDSIDEAKNDPKNEIIYPIQIAYDGLKSPIKNIKVKAWHWKYYNVDITETSINNGTLSFTLDIKVESTQREDNYPLKPIIITDSLEVESDKLSETRHKCKVFSLKDGINNIEVIIQEQGCPNVSFPFEITYTKPAARTKNKPAVKEDVVINKKNKKASVTPKASGTPKTPHLDL